jgi:hypothetical protein
VDEGGERVVTNHDLARYLDAALRALPEAQLPEGEWLDARIRFRIVDDEVTVDHFVVLPRTGGLVPFVPKEPS